MDGLTIVDIINKYKKCPTCGESFKSSSLHVEVKGNTVAFSCSSCGWDKVVDEKNNEIKAHVEDDECSNKAMEQRFNLGQTAYMMDSDFTTFEAEVFMIEIVRNNGVEEIEYSTSYGEFKNKDIGDWVFKKEWSRDLRLQDF